MGLDLIKTRTSVCDADIIVKLARAGELAVMGRVQDTVLVPERVRKEALKKIGTHGKDPSIADCVREGWLHVVDVYDSRQLQPDERALIGPFLNYLS
jgi:predicted nucleic acid-binding protein